MTENCEKEEAGRLALEAGFMLNTLYGQAADKMIPVTDIDTARMLIDLARRDLKAKLAEAEARIAELEAQVKRLREGATNMKCPKCESANITARHIPARTLINSSSTAKVDNEFVAVSEYDYFYKLTAKKEHLFRQCTVCAYSWREAVAP